MTDSQPLASPSFALTPPALRAQVVIIGGGLVGGTLAVALAQSGLSVLVLESEEPSLLVSSPFDGRASAVAASAQHVLAAVGLWERIAPEAAAIDEIRVTDGASPLFLHYDHEDVGDEPFGFIVENRTFRRSLAARFPELESLTVLAPVEPLIETIVRDGKGVSLSLADGRRVEAELLVAADGRASPTRRQAAIGLTHWDYHQTAIVCTVAHAKSHRNVAQEHFLSAGPFAILPLTDDPTHGHRSSIVWTEKTRLVPSILAQDDESFLRELHSRFGDFLGEIKVVGPRWSYPLSLQFADSYIAPRLALVGDAAHGMHPIAGQGMNMGLRDVAALAEVLVETARLGLDLGSPAVLERYQRWRRFDNILMLGLTDVLNRLFSNGFGPLALARDLGLAIVNKLPPVKKVFMRHAMGLVGDLPRLMRGESL